MAYGHTPIAISSPCGECMCIMQRIAQPTMPTSSTRLYVSIHWSNDHWSPLKCIDPGTSSPQGEEPTITQMETDNVNVHLMGHLSATHNCTSLGVRINVDTVPPLLTDHLRTQGRWSDDQGFWMVRVLGVGGHTPLKKNRTQRSRR